MIPSSTAAPRAPGPPRGGFPPLVDPVGTERAERAARARRSQLIFIYGSGLGIGLQAGLWNFTFLRSLPSAVFIILATLVYSMLTQLLWEWVLPRFAHLRLGRRLAAQAVVSALAYAVLSLAVTEVRALLLAEPSVLFPYSGPDVSITIPASSLRQAPLIFTLIPIVPVVLLCVVGFNQYWWRLMRLQSRQEELRALATAAQLAALRAQVNPHFLFNSLNSIAQLIATDPLKAETCVERLGDIYRYLLHRAQADFVPLDEELRVAESYLEIERARFGETLKVEAHIDARARELLLPSLILQPLVENAVKHGISPKIGGGRVTIEARVDEHDLHLSVNDTGVGLADEQPVFERGVGLRNVRDRLLRLYGAAYLPQVTSRPGDGTTVALRIPLRTAEA